MPSCSTYYERHLAYACQPCLGSCTPCFKSAGQPPAQTWEEGAALNMLYWLQQGCYSPMDSPLLQQHSCSSPHGSRL